MNRARRVAAGLVAALTLGVALSGVGPVAPAAADDPLVPGTSLGLQEARAAAVDPGTGRLFVAGDDEVVVRAPGGAAVGRVAAMYGAIAVTAAAGSIFVLLDGTTAIARIDPGTLAVTGRWSVAPRHDIWGLAYAGGRIWTSGRASLSASDTDLVSVDPTTGAVATHPVEAIAVPGYEDPAPIWRMTLVSSPLKPNLLISAGYDQSASTVNVFDISGPAVETVAAAYAEFFVHDLAVSPDAATVLVGGDGGPVAELRLPALTATGRTYPGGGTWHHNIDVAPLPGGGSLVLHTEKGDRYGPDLFVHRAGTSAPALQLQVDHPEQHLVPRGVVFAPDGSYAYVVRTDFYPHDGVVPASLVVVPLGPVVTRIQPRVVGTRGGGTVTIEGSGLALTSVRVGGQATTGATGSATARTVTVPALPVGPAPVVVTNAYGMRGASPVPVVVRELGPFRGSGAFADRQYRDFAGRAATAAEASAADAGLAGGASAGALPVSLARSVGFADRRAPIVRLYQAIFLRPPDTAGFEYWLGRVRAGRSLTWVASAMANAPEFKTRYGSLANGAFVDRIYSNVLGRPADASGKAYWVGQLNEGKPRGTIVVGFSQSPEYRAKMADQVDVTHLYLGMLRRTPTATELAAALATTQASAITSVAVGVLTSTEYRSRIG